MLYRLYHQEEVTLYEPQDVCFRCTCSRERCAGALLTLPDDEILEMLEEDGKIEMHCDYCGSDYAFDAMDMATLKASGGNVVSGNDNVH